VGQVGYLKIGFKTQFSDKEELGIFPDGVTGWLVKANGHINLYQLSESLADKLGGAKLESRCYTLIGLTVGECQRVLV